MHVYHGGMDVNMYTHACVVTQYNLDCASSLLCALLIMRNRPESNKSQCMEASISRLSTSVNSQLNSIQSLSLQNLREDLDRLRSVDLYQELYYINRV